MSNTMSTMATVMAINASVQASNARQQADKVLMLECKKNYDEQICRDVCVSQDWQYKNDVSTFKSNYTYTETNSCMSVPVKTWEQVDFNGLAFVSIFVGLILIFLTAVFISCLLDR